MMNAGLHDSTDPTRRFGDEIALTDAKEHAAAHCVATTEKAAEVVRAGLTLMAAAGMPVPMLDGKRPYLRAGEVAAVKPVIDNMQDMEHAMWMFRKLWGMNNRVEVDKRQYAAMRYQLREAEIALERLNDALDAESRPSGTVALFDDSIEADYPTQAAA